MALAHLGLLAAFGAGVVSFLSPCVFPLVPGYLSYIAGTTLREAQAEGAARWRVTAHALFFVLGFAVIFALLGAAASAVGATLSAHRPLVERAAGLLLVVFGLFLTGLVPVPFLQRERRAHPAASEPALLRSALVGAAFGAGWSPCIGPVLGSILALAATGTTLAQGVIFLLVYALGLGVPFLLMGLAIDRAGPVVRRVNRYTGPIAIAGGAIMTATGLLILSGQLAQLANYAPVFGL
jgi:cytochrome c-type biogenesis protein